MKQLAIFIALLSVTYAFSPAFLLLSCKARYVFINEFEKNSSESESKTEVIDNSEDTDEAKVIQIEESQNSSDSFIEKKRISGNFLKKHHFAQNLPFSEIQLQETNSDQDQFKVVNFDDEESKENWEDYREKFKDEKEDEKDDIEEQNEDVDDEVTD